ncbi:MAG: hypothetical protein PWP23_2674 [Candidatus Sumerlaeota bacterium]|nr:hypothetical protein [Candidatus Sumerlaeota bacterium]
MTAASAAGILVFLLGVPAIAALLFAFPRHRRLLLALMVFTICYVKKPFYQEVFFVNYRGVDRGFAVTIPDLFFFGFFLFALLGGLKRKLVWIPFNSVPWFFVILISALSLVGTEVPFYGTFTIHKFIRCWILYWVVVNVVREKEDVYAVLAGLAASLVFQGFLVFWSKYITGSVVNRSVGSFRHPNTLAMYVDLIGPMLMGALLSGRLPRRLNTLALVAIFAGFVSVIFTKSRAAIVLVPAALGCVIAVSLVMKPTARKMAIASVGMAGALLVLAIAMPRIVRRFQTAPEESAETRHYFNDAAKAMADENPVGIGINLYSWSLANTDYYWYVYPDMVDVPDPEEFRESIRGQSRLGTAHHIYWLYAAEIGYVGCGFFVLHLAIFSGLTAWVFIREKDRLHKGIALGILVGTTFHHVHGTLEWIFRQTEVQYLYFIQMGLIVAIWRMRPARSGVTPRKAAGRRKRELPGPRGRAPLAVVHARGVSSSPEASRDEP